MNKLMLAVGLFTVLSGIVQVAEAKGKRPTVCATWIETTMPIDGEATKVAICTDRAKPVILTTYSVVNVKDADGNSVKSVVGYR